MIRLIPNLKIMSRTPISTPKTNDTANTTMVCFVTVSLSGQTILLYSAFNPFQKLCFGDFFSAPAFSAFVSHPLLEKQYL